MTQLLSQVGLAVRGDAEGHRQALGQVRVSTADLADPSETLLVDGRETAIPPAPCDDPCQYWQRCKVRHTACDDFKSYVDTGKWAGAAADRVPLREVYQNIFERRRPAKACS